jgi:phage terminase large subunit-like protein
MAADPEKVIRLIEGHFRIPEGKLTGQPFTLHPFQKRIIREILVLDPDTRLRRIREAVVGLGRKNGKTALMAAIALALLILDDEPGGLILCVAAKRDQAAILLNLAKRIVQLSSLGGRPLTDFLVVQKQSIYFPETDTVMKIIASDAQKEHGSNPHIVFFDELHAQPDDELYETMKTAQGSRENPLIISITTAGPRPAGLCWNLYQYGKELEKGLKKDSEFCMVWFEAEPGSEVDDPKAWRDANPALGIFLHEKFMRQAARAVKEGRASEYMFRRLHLNQWTTATERWLPYAQWEACNAPPEIPEGSTIYLGMDAALSRDTFGVAYVYVDDEGTAHAVGRRFIPETEGDYISHLEVETYILGLSQRFFITDIAADPAFMHLVGNSLQDRGLPYNPFPQSADKMTEATETFQRTVFEGKLRHGGDKIMDAQLASVAVKPTERGVRISKQKTSQPIDLITALVMALQRAIGTISTQDFAFAVVDEDSDKGEPIFDDEF